MPTPPPSLNSLSHRTIENPGIWISLSLILSIKKVSHRHRNNVDGPHKSDNTLYFNFVFVKRRETFKKMKLYIWGRVTTVFIGGGGGISGHAWLIVIISWFCAWCISVISCFSAFICSKKTAGD